MRRGPAPGPAVMRDPDSRTAAPRSDATDLPRPTPALWLLAAATTLFYALTAHGYGIFRDELYYVACSHHLGLGYVDQPPLIGWITAAVRAVLGQSLPALRLLPALAAGATVWIAGLAARELGGGRFAQALAAVAALVAPAYLSLFTILSMNAFDVLVWAGLWWLVARILRTGNQRLWLAFGVLAGVGLENKISVLFLGFGVVVGLALARRWEVFKSPWLWAGGAIAGVLFAPHLVWQQLHGWPTLEFMGRARATKMKAFAPLDFLGEQALMAGPVSLPLWLAGLGALLAGRRFRPFRTLGWAYLAILVLLVASHGKPYYLAPAYVVLFAAGAAAVEAWSARWGGAALRAAALAVVAAGGIAAASLAKPLLSEDAFVRYAAFWGLAPSTDEHHDLGRLPQFFADMHGWEGLAADVARVYATLPAADRARACVFAENYGQAGAIDFFGPALGLPRAISGHNSYFLWGPQGCSGDLLLVLGGKREEVAENFAAVEPGGVHTCADCMPYENHKAIWIARGLKAPVEEAWPHVKHYD
jgi:Dolichyl-phosphate-mannose-protein mannosyltransferase